MTILDACRDRALFAPWFAGPSWRAWVVFLGALFGLPLDGDDLNTYRRHTSRTAAPTTPAREAWVVVGRRGGKSRVAALVSIYIACFRDYSAVLAAGEVGTLAVVAADRKQARTIMRYINGFLNGVPMLSAMVESRTAESVTLTNRVVIEVHTASWRTLRGYTLIGAVCDEIAFWRSEDAANPDHEILAGLRPGMATVPGALLLCISSPYARRGALWEAYSKHYNNQDGDPVLVWQGDTASMHPNVDAQVIADAYADDEAAAAANYGAEFRRDLEAFVSREIVEACTIPHRTELPRPVHSRVVSFTDPSGGSGGDSFTWAAAAVENERTLLLATAEFRPPLSPAVVVAAIAERAKAYGCSEIYGDHYGGSWPSEKFQECGIRYIITDHPRSEIYLRLLPLLASGEVELLDNPRLHAQLVSLERRTGRSGRDSVDHPPRGHDDLINAAAGAIVTAHEQARRCIVVGPGGSESENVWRL